MAGARLANEAWEAMLTAHAALLKRFAADEIWRGLTMREYDVLYTLAKSPTPMRLGELNRGVLLSQPALSRMVDRLAERGLVARSRDPDDRRSIRLSLTELGRAEQRRVGGRHAVAVARAFRAALTAAEMEKLAAICQKLTKVDGGPAVSSSRPSAPPSESGARRGADTTGKVAESTSPATST
jgi:DNA-binding MarR family transcriptional regulator